MRTINKTRFTMKLALAFAIASLIWVALTPNVLFLNSYAQAGTEVKCGSIVDGEFTKEGERHEYTINMATGESFNVTINTLVDYLTFYISAFGPTGKEVIRGETWPNREVSKSTGTLTKGMYKIYVANEGIGPYKLYIGCVTVNGEVKPGDIPQPTSTPAPLPTATPRSALPDAASAFTGTGFPGLAPVDFADAVTVPLLLDKEMIGVIPLDNQILGFTLDAAAGDTLDLSYTRVSGNMNLGLVVLSENNEVFFQASLVTSESLSTRFTLPEAEQYTIGVFRISLVEPDEVEPTVFQLKGTIVDSGQ
jgi:hypothetical protein